MSRTAVVIFNLGGPDSLEAVQPFLFNLFNDPLIIRQSKALRWLIAKIISARRLQAAREIYQKISGKSPILCETRCQSAALQDELGKDYRVFVAMRYWHPLAEECANEVFEYSPDRIILLPLYPQYSTTTTLSFDRAWKTAAEKVGILCPTTLVCCYPTQNGFIDALVELIRVSMIPLEGQPIRMLFSAHGLPQKFVLSGDPYQAQVEMTVDELVKRLNLPQLDYSICYQSRVGPVEWLRPYADDEICRAGKDGISIIVVPVAFVSEHSETLVELDIEYKQLAENMGVPNYIRVPTVRVMEPFIQGLASLVHNVDEVAVTSQNGDRICPKGFSACMCV